MLFIPLKLNIMIRSTLTLVFMSMAIILSAQNPFEKYGYRSKIATMTDNRFCEDHDSQSIVEIGIVQFDTRTGQVTGFVEADESIVQLSPELTSCFISPDPLCEKYYSISPYVF